MKKVLSLSIVALLAIGFVACKKDYTCKCTKSTTGTQDYKYEKVKKKDAEDACDLQNTAWALDGGSCKLD